MKAMLNTTTTFLIVAFAMVTIVFFGVNTMLTVTYSADVVAKDLEFLNIIDAAHAMEYCLDRGDGITEHDIEGFDMHACTREFPGMGDLDFEYMIEDIESGEALADSGYDSDSKRPSHSIYIRVVRDSGEVRLGRLHVQED